ncbi:MAG: Rne/Rng family ribonuclease [Alphaproteobacteria bacterium]|nr:Rne/Rng family ribonuclease [Alphaproteobacteria bacterium]
MADRPHDEVDEPEDDAQGDDEAGVSAEAYAEEMRAYQADQLADQEQSHDHDHHFHPVAASGEAVETAPVETMVAESAMSGAGVPHPAMESPVLSASAAETHVAGLGPEAAHELGLITDFGNAIVDTGFGVPTDVAPIEVVGGEVAEEEEEEQRIRRPRARSYKIQEVVKRRQIMLIQVVKEERGNKGAALTTYLSLAGRYCVLMPNTDRGGGVSRKITSHQDRKRMKDMLDQLETPEGMAVILRTAGMEQEPAEIQRDLEHLLRLWNNIREQTLASTAPTLIYEEANLIKRSIRDLYAADVEEILVSGQKGYHLASDFMRSMMPEQVGQVKLYEDAVPLFFRYNVEKQIDQLYNPVVQLRSGGYIVINPTEALVSIDVNSGRATRERHIESTALKTNLEAADEVARQLRLRDLAGLIVIDFIDMEDGRNNAAVERRMKEAMKADRARLQIGRISPFGLMELSRQRLHPSLTEINFERCPHCAGVGLVRSAESSAISILRMIEEEGIRQPGGELTLHMPTAVALYILNQKRAVLHGIEQRYRLQVFLRSDDTLVPPDCKMERARGGQTGDRSRGPAVDNDQLMAQSASIAAEMDNDSDDDMPARADVSPRSDDAGNDRNNDRGGRRRGRYGRGRDRDRGGRDRNRGGGDVSSSGGAEPNGNIMSEDAVPDDNIGNVVAHDGAAMQEDARQDGARQEGRGRRRGRRGGRGRRNGSGEGRPGDGRQGGGNQDNNRGEFRDAGQPGNYAPEPVAPAPAYVAPFSIHDIDTTPRESGPRDAAPRQAASSPYEVIDHATDDKAKGGWWRKLTGQ